MKLKITQDFKFAHRGVEVREYAADTEVETDDAELVEIATREGWAEPADDETQAAAKPAKAARKAA